MATKKVCRGPSLQRLNQCYQIKQHNVVLLTENAWNMLWNLRSQIQVKWDNQEEERWHLENEVYLSLQKFLNYTYLHIRQWNPEGYPSKSGVTFTRDEWQEFTAQMNPPFEALLHATTALLMTKRPEICLGYQDGDPNQTDHPHLEKLCQSESYFESCYDSVTREDFINCLPQYFWPDCHWMKTIVSDDEFQTFKTQEKDNISQEIKKIWCVKTTIL